MFCAQLRLRFRKITRLAGTLHPLGSGEHVNPDHHKNNSANHQILPCRINVQNIHDIGNGCQHDCADDGTENAAFTAKQRGSADNNRGNNLQAIGVSSWSLISGIAEALVRVIMAKVLFNFMGVEVLFFIEPFAWLAAWVFVLVPYYVYAKRRLE